MAPNARSSDLIAQQIAAIDDEINAILGSDDEQLSKTNKKRPAEQDESLPDDLGIDNTINTKRRRNPAPKLTPSLLLSQDGIPKLQKMSKSNLKLRGKGHEFSDIATLLGTYQVWIHELYPRAKFNDGLSIIEKLGHTKQMQKLRSQWINESKHSYQDDEPQTIQPRSTSSQKSDFTSENNVLEISVTQAEGPVPVENGLHQILTEDELAQSKNHPDYQDDSDELDKIIAENLQNNKFSSVSSASLENNDYDDEDEVMRELGI